MSDNSNAPVRTGGFHRAANPHLRKLAAAVAKNPFSTGGWDEPASEIRFSTPVGANPPAKTVFYPGLGPTRLKKRFAPAGWLEPPWKIGFLPPVSPNRPQKTVFDPRLAQICPPKRFSPTSGSRFRRKTG